MNNPTVLDTPENMTEHLSLRPENYPFLQGLVMRFRIKERQTNRTNTSEGHIQDYQKALTHVSDLIKEASGEEVTPDQLKSWLMQQMRTKRKPKEKKAGTESTLRTETVQDIPNSEVLAPNIHKPKRGPYKKPRTDPDWAPILPEAPNPAPADNSASKLATKYRKYTETTPERVKKGVLVGKWSLLTKEQDPNLRVERLTKTTPAETTPVETILERILRELTDMKVGEVRRITFSDKRLAYSAERISGRIAKDLHWGKIQTGYGVMSRVDRNQLYIARLA